MGRAALYSTGASLNDPEADEAGSIGGETTYGKTGATGTAGRSAASTYTGNEEEAGSTENGKASSTGAYYCYWNCWGC